MSDTEKEKDVTCFTVDGVVAEMVIEVEENQKVGVDDLTSSPSKDNHSDKNNDLLSDKKDSDDTISEKVKENEIVELDTQEEDEENSLEIIETDKTEEYIEDKKSEEKNNPVVEDKTDNIVQSTEDEKNDEVNQNIEVEDKITDEMNEKIKENIKLNENQQNLKSTRTTHRKRKNDKPMKICTEKDIEESDMPRYPGRKRLANKRYISEDMITPKRKISESVDFKDSPKGIKLLKRRKIDEKSEEKSEIKDSVSDISTQKSDMNETQNVNDIEEPDTPQEPEKKLSRPKGRPRGKSDVGSEKSISKQSVLRKLPFRKNKDAPDVPDLKPKVFWWNGVGKGYGVKLGDIPEIRDRIRKAKSIRAIYRVLYFQWPKNGADMVAEILKFNGFPFDKTSYEYTKRQSLMKIMLDKTIFYMCELLDIRKGDKQENIKNILNFLLKPYAKFDPAIDPYWQPAVQLERIDIDNAFLEESSNDVKPRRGRSLNSSRNTKAKDSKSTPAVSPDVTPVRSTRSSGPRRIELIVYPDPERIVNKMKEDQKANKAKLSTPKELNRSGGNSGKPNVKESGSATKVKSFSAIVCTPGGKKTTPVKAKTSPAVKEEKAKPASAVKSNKEKSVPPDVKKNIANSVKKDIKPPPKELKKQTEEIQNNMSSKLKRKKILNKKRKKIISTSHKKVPEKKEISTSQSKEDSDACEIEMTIDSGPDMDVDSEVKETDTENSPPQTVAKVTQNTKPAEKTKNVLQNAVSMVILSDSSETESAEETKLVTAKRAPKIPMKRKGKPLKQFPKISDSIQNANFSALQRLHILLFGASDKAENLKSNILAFGGFPFLEGSDEWKQKHFLLSLLAQNNLREYLNLLCIPYLQDDQPTMINKLMRFLAIPSEELLEGISYQTIETEVVSSVLVDKSSPVATTSKGKGETKKKVKKKEEKKVSKARRKILMSEEEARRLEANFAREQRALAREKKLPPFTPGSVHMTPNTPLTMHSYTPLSKSSGKVPITDPEQLNALLQTVYKRRALKAAGAVISTPKTTGQRPKLGDIENIKFLIVTSNLKDLEILHRLIYMLEASKARIRKNILDFDGFGFNEDSPKYKHRMDYLNSLGYDASKRISFLLGLCPLNTTIPQNDLNELVMYFLMAPCKTKSNIPITQLPNPDEPHIIVKSTANLDMSLHITNPSLSIPVPGSGSQSGISQSSSNDITLQHSTPVPKPGAPKAKKTFPSSSKVSPIKKVLLPPSQSPVLGVSTLGNKPQKITLLNSIPAVPAYSLPKSVALNAPNNASVLNTTSLISNTPKSPLNSLHKFPASSTSGVQILNQGLKMAVSDAALKIPASVLNIPSRLSNIPVSMSNAPRQIVQNQILIPQISNKGTAQPQLQTSLLHGSKMVVKPPTAAESPQEFIVQQQTPDGQNKIFKLIKLPPNHPLVTNAGKKTPGQQTASSPQLPQQVVLTTNSTLSNLPPGLILMKNSAGQLQNLQISPNAPVKFLPLSATSNSAVLSTPAKTTVAETEKIISPAGKESVSTLESTSLDNSMEVSSSSENSPPTDEDLFSSIQEIILSSNFEDITLRNVIERVAGQYPNHDLANRHNYMKECVKKIIIGT